MNTLNKNTKTIPKNISQYLNSIKAVEINLLICKKYNIKGEKIGIVTDIISKLFSKDLKIDNLISKLQELLGVKQEQAKKIAVDIAGMRLLIIDDWLDGEVSKYLIGEGAGAGTYVAYVNEHKKAIKEEAKYFKNELSDDEPFVFEPKEAAKANSRETDLIIERRDTKELFAEGLADILIGRDNPYLDDYNKILILLLSDETNYNNELEKSLYRNEEKITHKNFVLDKKAKAPSIKNWLRYFIEIYGSGMFNNLELTKFISEADNCKELDDSEKKTVSKLLRTYRNIKFFPQAMGNLPIKQWEIIPLEKKEKESRASQLKHIKKPSKADLITELKGNIDNYAEGSLEREILEEESEKDQEYHKLLLLAKKYPKGSLERRAVEDEMAKLEK